MSGRGKRGFRSVIRGVCVRVTGGRQVGTGIRGRIPVVKSSNTDRRVSVLCSCRRFKIGCGITVRYGG